MSSANSRSSDVGDSKQQQQDQFVSLVKLRDVSGADHVDCITALLQHSAGTGTEVDQSHLVS